ncbi:MAG TPA: FAD-binding oxidoreductase [Candidatus Dormibacteraeota bacterium]|nr:FAD-binding oxidoreductase [Candidatus Dormibacteraeota bacterium]
MPTPKSSTAKSPSAKSHSAQTPDSHLIPHPRWGAPPWYIDFAVRNKPVPPSVDFAVVGGGFTGLAAAAWLRRLAPEKSVAVFEADRIGAGASGRTGGMALAESAAGDLPGLGDVLGGLDRILAELDIDCDLSLPGAFEIGRGKALKDSPIQWNDSGTLRVVKKVPGGTLDPGKLVAGLARVADERGAAIIESHPVTQIEWQPRPVAHAVVHAGGSRCSAGKILFATNALALELTSLAGRAEPKLTLAVLAEPMDGKRLEAIGLAGGNPFYTVDLPYLWGRCLRDGSVIFGAGLVDADDSLDLTRIDITTGDAKNLFESIERRIHNLHPELREIKITHRWGGPILFRENWRPVFMPHPQSKGAIVLGAYAGHGVALSVYLGAWAAEALLGRRKLPSWGSLSK